MKAGHIIGIVLGIAALAGGGYAIYHYTSSDKSKDKKDDGKDKKKDEVQPTTEPTASNKVEPSLLLNKQLTSPIAKPRAQTFKF